MSRFRTPVVVLGLAVLALAGCGTAAAPGGPGTPGTPGDSGASTGGATGASTGGALRGSPSGTPLSASALVQFDVPIPQRGPQGTAAALARARWSAGAPSPLAGSDQPALTWTGAELIEIGQRGTPEGSARVAAYDPGRDAWRALPAVPAELGAVVAPAVWTGRELFVLGGARTPAAGLLDPARRTWRLAAPGGPGPLDPPADGDAWSAVWTGHQVVVARSRSGTQSQLQAAVYDPAADRWTRIDPPHRAGRQSLGVELVAVPDGVLLWSLWQQALTGAGSDGTWRAGVDVFRLDASGRWADVGRTWPGNHTVDAPVFTGTSILLAPGQIWCGMCPHPAPHGEHGVLVDPRTLARTDLPPGPADDLGPQYLWTGSTVVSLNTSGSMTGPGVDIRPGDTAFWNGTTRAWVAAPRAPATLAGTAVTWTGRRLLTLAADGRVLSFGAG